MRHLLLLAALGAALGLGACATPSGTASVADSIELATTTADTALDATYKLVATAYLKAVPSLSAADHATYKAALQKARTYVVAADAGQDVVNNAAAATQLLTSVAAPLGVSLTPQ